MLPTTSPSRNDTRNGNGHADDADWRIAATGGYRRVPSNPKSDYQWPGMTALPAWQQTRVHRHTAYYGCAKCGARFKSPGAAYVHLARAHPVSATRSRLARRRRSLGDGAPKG
jgi:hypothetical protein